MCKRAIILAGGKGTRLRPYTIALPKPLVPIGEKPILEIIIMQLIRSGFEHITITINHFADIIKSFFGDGSKWRVKIDYSLEEKPLSTMGPLNLIADLPENFLIMNGDVLSDVDFEGLYDFHIFKNSIFTISSYARKQKTDYGVLEIDSNDKLSGFKEKPVEQYDVSMGIYMANKKILRYIPNNKFYGFDSLMHDLIKNNNLPFIKRHDGYWFDIGRPDDYEEAANHADKILLQNL
jgi:NDP-sugar pyrophosphorylase family protein